MQDVADPTGRRALQSTLIPLIPVFARQVGNVADSAGRLVAVDKALLSGCLACGLPDCLPGCWCGFGCREGQSRTLTERSLGALGSRVGCRAAGPSAGRGARSTEGSAPSLSHSRLRPKQSRRPCFARSSSGVGRSETSELRGGNSRIGGCATRPSAPHPPPHPARAAGFWGCWDGVGAALLSPSARRQQQRFPFLCFTASRRLASERGVSLSSLPLALSFFRHTFSLACLESRRVA